jgi:PatG C-terminal
MHQNEAGQTPLNGAGNLDVVRALNADAGVAPQNEPGATDASCPTCSAAKASGPMTFVYAMGRIEPRFPRLSVEKEFAQATAHLRSAPGLTDRQALQAVLSMPENRYLARQLCWVLTIEGLETYLVVPRDPMDLQRLVEAVRPISSADDLDVVIGVRGPLAAPEMCNGLMIPIVVFDQIYSFDREALLKAIPSPTKGGSQKFAAAAAELFDRIMLTADNAGATDDQRAVNYLAVRYPAIYHKAAEMYSQNTSLTAIDVRTSALSGTRKIVDVIFSYTHRQTDVSEKSFCRVDVTEEFPFLVTKLSPYFDRS